MKVRPVPRVAGALLLEPRRMSTSGFIPWPLQVAAVSLRDRAAPPLVIAEKSLLP